MRLADQRGDEIAAAAEDAVSVATTRAAVTIANLEKPADVKAASAVFDSVWPTAGSSGMPAELLRAFAHSGNYVAGAVQDGEVVGAAVGFLGRLNGSTNLHSHMVAVLPGARGRNVGFALKQHQRAWALARGISVMTWTFDPLVRRNAYFNIVKLGAEVSEYHEDFYGSMRDAVNAGDESDRVVAKWSLLSARVREASLGAHVDQPVDELRAAGAVATLGHDEAGWPVAERSRAPILLCYVPEDIVALRSTHPRLAQTWRRALRDALGEAMAGGYSATGVTRSGWYVLTRES